MRNNLLSFISQSVIFCYRHPVGLKQIETETHRGRGIGFGKRHSLWISVNNVLEKVDLCSWEITREAIARNEVEARDLV